jgi:hypothetical protein
MNPWEMDWSGQKKPWEMDWGGQTAPMPADPAIAQAQQAAQDNAMIAQKPIGARLIKAAQGLPFVGQWLDEARSAIRGPAEGEKLRAMEDAMDRQHPGQSAALGLAGGVLGSIPAAAALPATVPAMGAYGAAEGATSAYGKTHDPQQALASGLISGGLSAGTTAVTNAILNRIGVGRAIEKVPSTQDVADKASTLYETGRQSGATAAGANTQSLSANLRDLADTAEILEPDGKVAAKYPNIAEVLRVTDKYAGKDMTPGQMQTVRETLNDAAAAGGKEGRVGVQAKSLFDDWVNNFVPEFKQANKLWSDMSDAKGIEDAAKIAGTRVGGGSSVDLRNAMATLRRGEIEGTVHHPPEVQAVIDSLTKKGAFDNLSRATRAGLGYGGGLGTLGTLAYGASTGNCRTTSRH